MPTYALVLLFLACIGFGAWLWFSSSDYPRLTRFTFLTFAFLLFLASAVISIYLRTHHLA